MELKLSELAALLGTEVRGKHRGSKAVSLCTDSRALKRDKCSGPSRARNSTDIHSRTNHSKREGMRP